MVKIDPFDEKLILDMDLMQRSVSVTYDNSLSKEMIYNDIDVANIHRRNNQDLLLDAIDNFKVNSSIKYESNTRQFQNLTYNNYDTKESIISKYVESFSNSDDERTMKTLPSIVNYKDDYLTSTATNVNQGLDVTYTQYSGTQDMKTALNNFSLNADIPREENAFNVDHYMDKESQKLSVWGDKSKDMVYNVHMINEMIDDEQENLFSDKESFRNINVSELNTYNDRLMLEKSDQADYDKKGDYFQYMEQ